MENFPEQNIVPQKTPWQEFAEKARTVETKMREIKNALGRTNTPSTHVERFSTQKLIDIIQYEINKRIELVDFNQKRIQKGEISQYDQQKAGRDISLYQGTINNYRKILPKIEAKQQAGANELHQIIDEAKKAKKQNQHLKKISQKIIAFEKIEKNNYKQDLIEQGKIKDKLQGIRGVEILFDFEIKFYQRKKKEAERLLGQTSNTEEQKAFSLDVNHYNHLIMHKTAKFNDLINKLNNLKNIGKIDHGLNIINRKNFSNEDNQVVVQAKNLLNAFNNYNNDNLKNKQKLKEKIAEELGRPLGKSQTQQMKDLAEFRYKNSSYKKRIEEMIKKLQGLEKVLGTLQNPSPEQSSLDDKQKELERTLEALNLLLNKPVYNQRDGIEIDQLELKKNELKKEIKKESEELAKKKIKTLKELREKIAGKLEKIEKELVSAKNGQKIIKAIYTAAQALLESQKSIYDLHKITTEDEFINGKILEFIDQIIHPEAQNEAPEPKKKKDGEKDDDDKKEGDKQSGGKQRDNNRNKKRGGRNRGRGGNRGRR
ncbi:MAG TPA: hypothetical protein PLB38_00490 [bacterium]|nr:hypothetical protein [bacterium]